jgi:hypothetical protein
MLPTHEDFARDIGVFLEDHGFGDIDEEDPIEMMTRKSEREIEKEVMNESDLDQDTRGCRKVDQGELQELQSVQGNSVSLSCYWYRQFLFGF